MKRALPATLAFLWLIGPLAMAQDTGSLQGHVTDPSGAPIYGTVVIIERADGSRHAAVTDVTRSVQISSLAAVLQLAPEVTTVTVGLEPEEVAAEQLHQELKQRDLGVIPNYYVTYESHPAPLSPAQKFHLSLKMLLDPTTFTATGITAGIQQEMNSYHQFGQGSEGFAKRFGAAYATGPMTGFTKVE